MSDTGVPRRRARGGLAGVVVACALFVGACGGPPVSIRLVAADDLVVPPEFVRLVFRPAGAEAIETEIASTASLPTNEFAAVPPAVVFSVDVIGCKTNAADECATEDTFVARGCVGNLVRGRDDALDIEVPVHGAVVGNPLCPIEAPES